MRSANKGARSDDWEPALGMAGDGQDVTVRVAEGVDGSRSAVLLPASARRLNGEQTEVLSQMQHVDHALAEQPQQGRREIACLLGIEQQHGLVTQRPDYRHQVN